jgi:3-oxoacyl-[acyl-carrier protein] reductase
VNAVLSGLVDTEMISKIPEKERRAVEKRIPLRRVYRVAEIGRFVKYPISDDASYITGQAFSIDGGCRHKNTDTRFIEM